MVNEAPVCVGLAVDVVYCVKRVFETFVNSNAVAFTFLGLVCQSYCLVDLCFLVNVSQLVLPQRFSFASLLLLRTTHKRYTICLSVLFTNLVTSWSNSCGNCLFPRLGNTLVRTLLHTYGPILSYF